ncbi:uncharacterized protein ACR2FA_000703 [Aphomia sociella]
MSLFNLEVQPKEKNISHHPWERAAKDVYSNKIKYAHNSINNPQYPKTKKNLPNADRVKFTIIGNRVTREFNYCVHLIKGLHKYRWKYFDSPVIRGVTSVEWPSVWNDLKNSHGGLAYCLDSQVAILMNDKFLGGEKELKELIENKYIYHFHLDYYKEGVTEFAKFIRSTGRPCAYMHISIDDEHVGTMIFMLYADIVPYTCENFLRLCKEKKGGYGGTPVHRIVKDGWIQCGGYGLKSTDLDCENFIVPHDRRGVICMANDGRHVDCLTQFFVLLQPAPWMQHKYVAFGQLIDGNETLKKIESVPTWYESPKNEIVIFQSGIFNMECHHITINKRTREYIQGHIDDLIAVGEIFYEMLMEKVFLEIEFRLIVHEKLEAEGEREDNAVDTAGNLRATQRFIRKKEDIEKQIEKSQLDRRGTSMASDTINAEAIEMYEYEPEEFSYQHVSLDRTASVVVKPEQPFYFPLTDVPYPGEVDSTYDLKKFLKGDYCLETDLEYNAPKKLIRQKRKHNVDRVSFAGGIIKTIARGIGQYNLFEGSRKSELITDEELRRLRKVSISLPSTDTGIHQQIKRRQTGFVRPEDLEKIHIIHKSEETSPEEEESVTRKVRIAPTPVSDTIAPHPARRPTGFVRGVDIVDSDTQVPRHSVLQRLYEDVTLIDDHGPTLKEFKPMSEARKKSILLTYSPFSKIKYSDSREKYLHQSITIEDDSVEQVLNLQHGKKMSRKISSDYVKIIDQMEHRLENSIRSIEFAKTRPSMSISEYQMKNQKYQEEQRASKVQVKTIRESGQS